MRTALIISVFKIVPTRRLNGCVNSCHFEMFHIKLDSKQIYKYNEHTFTPIDRNYNASARLWIYNFDNPISIKFLYLP